MIFREWSYMKTEYLIEPIGFIISPLKKTEDAPKQGSEGGEQVWLEINTNVAAGLDDIKVGDEITVITWLHRADRTILKVHPRDDQNQPLTGVFSTRSADRPNPLGLHNVIVLEISGIKLKIEPIEAIDGTPVIDLKPVHC
jgi:tRNA-Thr(GGU) m(6)t(6)A37 methyltransferase TsaA